MRRCAAVRCVRASRAWALAATHFTCSILSPRAGEHYSLGTNSNSFASSKLQVMSYRATLTRDTFRRAAMKRSPTLRPRAAELSGDVFMSACMFTCMYVQVLVQVHVQVCTGASARARACCACRRALLCGSTQLATALQPAIDSARMHTKAALQRMMLTLRRKPRSCVTARGSR